MTGRPFSSLSAAILVFVGAAGPSAGTVLVHHAGAWPPWFGSMHLADWAVTAVMWVALLLGVAGVTAGLAAVRQGWRPSLRWLVAGALTAVAALAVVPAIGSTDTLDYAAYGRIAAMGHSPYVTTPEQLRRAHDPVGVLAPHIWEKLPSVYGPLATASEWAASELGGSSAAVTIFWIKVWNGLAGRLEPPAAVTRSRRPQRAGHRRPVTGGTEKHLVGEDGRA